MAEIAGTSNFASEIATLSISIFSNTEAKYSKKSQNLRKKANFTIKISSFSQSNEKLLKKLLKLLEMMKWQGFKGSVALAKSLLEGFSKN